MRALTAYGHSWVGGAGATSTATRLVNRTARALGLDVDNRGVSGTSSAETAQLVRRDPPPPAAAFLIMTGLNDARLYGLSSDAIDRYHDALTETLTAVTTAAPAAAVVVVEQPQLLDYSGYAPHDRGSDEAVDRYNGVAREVAAGVAGVAAGVDGVVAVRVTGWDRHTMLDDDAVHPNDAGHDAIARVVTAALAQVVPLANGSAGRTRASRL